MEESINYRYVIVWVFTIALGFFYLGYSYRCFNALTYALHMQYMNEGKFVIEDRDLFNSVVSGAIPIGAIIGSIFGGILVEKGRRKAIIILCIMQIIGSMFCVVFDFMCLVSGRLIQGVVIGSFTVVSPLFISEISPKSVSGSLGMSNQGMVVFGGILAKLFGLIVPLKGDDDILTSDNWKLIFAFPGIISFIQLLLILFIFRYDSPTYYLMHHDLQKYSLINSKIYNKSEGNFSVVCVQDGCGQSNSDKNSWLNQFSISNRKTLIIGCVLSLFQQATGVNCVSFYSNEMFMQGLAGDDAEISARVGTLIVDIISISGVFTASFLLKIYGPKTIMKYGVASICWIYCGLCIFSVFEISIMIRLLIFLFMFAFNISIGGLLWAYIAEILSPKGICIAAQINCIGAFMFGSTANLFFKLLGPSVVYASYAGVQLISFLFISIFIKETKGLNKLECEQLYKLNKKEYETELV